MIEALACGTPVAAYPVAGPARRADPGLAGAMAERIEDAIAAALALEPRGTASRMAAASAGRRAPTSSSPRSSRRVRRALSPPGIA